MIASWRGLGVLVAIAAALGIVLIVGEPRTPPPSGGALVTEVPAATAVEITRTGQPPLRLTKERAGWRSHAPRFHVAPDAMSALLSTLRGAKWHRRAPARTAGTLRGEVRLFDATGDGAVDPRAALTFGIGGELPGADQTWIVHGGRALLVDNWVVNAIWPEPLALRVRRPLAEPPRGPIIASSVRVEGQRLVRPHAVWLEPDLLRELLAALADLEIVSLDGMTPGPPQPTITADHMLDPIEIAVAGTCAADRLLMTSTTGDGCIERASWERVLAAVAALDKPAGEIADRRPLPFTPSRLVLPDGIEIELAGQPRVGDEVADSERIGELLAALAAPAEIVPRPTAPPARTLTASDPRTSDEVVLELYAGVLARRGEPIALRPRRDAWAILVRPATALRDPVLWREDATTISSIAIDGITYKRGAVLGEWTREPAGPFDPALVDALASALAVVRAPEDPVPLPRVPIVKVTFTPPAGKPVTRELAIGPPAADGCPARVDGAAVRLDLALCTAVHALAAAR